MNTHPDYYISQEEMAKLRAIERALYDDHPMTPDRRRDLANLMWETLNKATPLPQGDIPQ